MTAEEKQAAVGERAVRLAADGYRFDKAPGAGQYTVTPPRPGARPYTVTLYVDGTEACTCPYKGPGLCKHTQGLLILLRACPALDNGLAPQARAAWDFPEAFLRARELDFG